MTNETTPIPEKASGMDTNRKIMLILVAVLIVAIVGMFVWKSAAVNTVEKKLVQVQTERVQERADLIEQARQLDARYDVESLKRFSTPLAWAIRRELMASNLDQIDQYLTELVQMAGFQSAVLANPEDKVIVASDRKMLSEAFSAIYPGVYLQVKEVKVEPSTNGGLRAIIPIMGLSQQLGTLVVE
ncbi:MAG: hypothetical protein GZ085_03935, partial [Sulfuriferula multivorans]|nr:hypothetical protein [Sulfuriferula multivorans]